MDGRIMVVDDDLAMLAAYCEILADEGLEAVCYRYATIDVTEIEHLNPDLIVLDLLFCNRAASMTLLQALKVYAPARDIPVLVCTASEYHLRQWQHLVDRLQVPVIIKPFDLDTFLGMVWKTMRRREACSPS